jgi:hypothetical protein
MCKMNIYVVSKLVLGNRSLGWECWDGRLSEYTTKQLKDMIVAGKQKVCGLRIGDNEEPVGNSRPAHLCDRASLDGI